MIVVQLLGGLGNQMFQYAVGRHLAYINNSRLKLDRSFLDNRVPIRNFTARNYELSIFNIPSSITELSNFPAYDSSKSIKSIPNRLLHFLQIYFSGYSYIKEFDSGFNSKLLKRKGELYLDGYWQSFKYFDAIKDIIQEDFSFKNIYDGDFKIISDQITSTNSICVHIRRTDYLNDKILGVDQNKYLKAAFDIMLNTVENPSFFVFSDDIEWCMKNIQEDFRVSFVSKSNSDSLDYDFQLMTLCKHFIIANSSFSWWAAWLSKSKNKIVIAPKTWTLNNSIDINSILPENWVKI